MHYSYLGIMVFILFLRYSSLLTSACTYELMGKVVRLAGLLMTLGTTNKYLSKILSNSCALSVIVLDI